MNQQICTFPSQGGKENCQVMINLIDDSGE